MGENPQDRDQEETGALPCSGIRVVDLTSLVSGPYCSQILADLGADVIKVESEGSDVMRMQPPHHHGIGAYFEQVNRGKRSVAINLKSEEGRDFVRRLVATADVFVQNSRPGVMERLGFGYEAMRPLNDRLIYVSINGFGEGGPFAGRPAYDAVVQGLTGFMTIQGSEEAPMAVRSVVADKITAMWAANAAVAALLHRERNDGRGQKIVVNMTAAYSAFMLLDQMQAETFRSVELENDFVRERQRTIDTADGKVIGMILQPHQCRRFCLALGATDLADDPRLQDSRSIVKNVGVIYDAVAERVRSMTTAQFVALMEAESIPFGPVNTVKSFIASEEAAATGSYVDVQDPDLGVVRHLGYPAKFERISPGPKRRAPRLGEHTDELKAQLYG